MTETRFAPERIIASLNAGGVRYVIVGGLAVAAHGVVRATRDLDLVPEPSAENLDRLATTLCHLGAERSITCVTLGRPVSFKLRIRHGEVQVLNRVSGVPTYADLMATAITVEMAGTHASFCSLADLRAMKLASGRPVTLSTSPSSTN